MAYPTLAWVIGVNIGGPMFKKMRPNHGVYCVGAKTEREAREKMRAYLTSTNRGGTICGCRHDPNRSATPYTLYRII